MSEGSAPSERARRATARVLKRIDTMTARSVALAMGKSESTISRIKPEIDGVMQVLYQIGLKVVEEDCEAVPRAHMRAMRMVLARELGRGLQTPAPFSGEEDA